MSEPYLDAEILRRILHYDPETGIFVWLHRSEGSKNWNAKYADKMAGYNWRAGPRVTYRCIRIFDYPFLGHRLAYLYVTGEWPAGCIDHRDMDGLNNRWGNLRPATRAQNSANTKALSTNRSGYKGVSVCKTTGRIRAYITVNRRQRHLGNFETLEAAAAARRKAAELQFGEFARES